MHPAPTAPIVILTGAGISAESGIPTFRASDGLWENHPVEAVATPEGFARDPALVHRFYNERRRKLASVVPNAAHLALAELEARWPGGVLVVTQNVDDLHDRAGSKNLIHMHGELLRARCAACETVVVHSEDLDLSTACTACGTVGRMRPHIVWFGEMPIGLPRIYKAVSRCGLFVAIGTSGNVYPASSLVDVAPPGARTLEINLQPSAVASAFREHRTGPATVEVPAWVQSLMRTLAT